MKQLLFTTFIYHQQQANQDKLTRHVDGIKESVILDPELAEEAISEIVELYKLKPVTIQWDHLKSGGYRERTVRERGAWGNLYDDNEQITETVYSFTVPYSGSRKLLGLHPDHSRTVRHEFDVTDNQLTFEIVGSNNPEANKLALGQLKENVNINIERLNAEVKSFNANLETHVRKGFENREQRARKNKAGLDSFGLTSSAEQAES